MVTQDPRLRLQAVSLEGAALEGAALEGAVPDGARPDEAGAGRSAAGSVRRGWPTAPPGTPGAGLAYAEYDVEPSRASAWDPPPRGPGRWLPASWVGARWDPGRWGAVALAVVVVLAAGIAVALVWSGRPVAEQVPALPAVSESAGGARTGSAGGTGTGSADGVAGPPSASRDGGGSVVVHVAGKVRRPGLVTLAASARVGEAVEAAGGALPAVDLTPLNLAARVVDGQQIVVGAPPAAAGGAAPTGGPGGGVAGSAGAPAPGGKLDLNAATLDQLDGLPGVGPVTAKKILDWRTQNGRFSAVEQLREIPGIGEARFATLRELVRV